MHEKNNEIVNGSGGAIFLTEHPTALKRWMVAGPEHAIILTEFEEQWDSLDQVNQNYEQGYSTQGTFKIQVTDICDTIVTMGNPFIDMNLWCWLHMTTWMLWSCTPYAQWRR